MCYCTALAAEEKCTKQTLNILTIQTEKSPFPCDFFFFFYKHPKLALPDIPTKLQTMLFLKSNSI